ncbi:MAG: glycosyltransferase family 39 protein [Elusimicrobiales bacterium]|nr:glycosyltransferase family 39 protein [Elusimicrobiales bacterium]
MKEKFLATRLALEKILFEKEISSEKKLQKKYYKHLFLLVSIYFFINLLYFYFNIDIVSYHLSSIDYSKITFMDILFHTDYLSPSFEMPLYAIILKLISFIFELNIWSVFVINTIAWIFGILGYYLLIAKTRNEQTGLLAVAALISTPFFINLTRQVSGNILSFAFLIWSYYYYIRMKTEEQYKSVPYFIIFYSLGLLSDKFFILYTIPSFSFISFLFNTTYANHVISIFIPAAIISIIFYIRFIIIFIIKLSLNNEFILSYFNFKELFQSYINYFGLVSFVIIFPFFIWMVFSLYNIYICKKEIFRWFFYPVLVFFIISISPKILGFTVPAIILGFSVMTFGTLRKKLVYFFTLMMVLSSFDISSLNFRGYKLWGYAENSDNKKIVKHILYALSNEQNLIPYEVPVSVKLYEKNINSDSFEILKERYMIKKFKFRNCIKEFLPFSCYLITDKKDYDIKDFEDLFLYRGVYLLKNSFCNYKLDKDSYYIPKIKVSEMEISDINLKVVDTDISTDNLKDLYIDIGYLGYRGIDFYGVKGVLKDVIINTDNKYIISSFSKLEIKNAIINQYSIAAALENTKGKKIELIFMNNVIKFVKKFNFFDMVIYLSPEIKDNVIYLKLLGIRIGGFSFGVFFSDFFVFKLPLDKFPFPLKFSKIQITNELIKLS